MSVRVEVDRDDLRRLIAALKAEADGKKLRRDLVRGLRAAATPAAQAAKASILSMGSSGRKHPTPGLRTSIARHVRVQVRTSGKRAGVRVSVKKLVARGFRNAPKRLNSAKGWRHPVFGSDNWVTQMGKPDWFDAPLRAIKPEVQAAAKRALDDVAKRISERTRRG